MTGGHDRQARFVFEWLEYETKYRARPGDKDRVYKMMMELLDMLDLDAVSREDLDWEVYRYKVRKIRDIIYKDALDGEDADE